MNFNGGSKMKNIRWQLRAFKDGRYQVVDPDLHKVVVLNLFGPLNQGAR